MAPEKGYRRTKAAHPSSPLPGQGSPRSAARVLVLLRLLSLRLGLVLVLLGHVGEHIAAHYALDLAGARALEQRLGLGSADARQPILSSSYDDEKEERVILTSSRAYCGIH